MLNDSIYILMFSTGLFGGFGHCTGMCGPLIASYTISIQASPLDRLKPHLIYHSGRIMSYSLIGGFMGLTGSFVSLSGTVYLIQSIAMALAGIIMIIMGLSILQVMPSFFRGFLFFREVTVLIKRLSLAGDMGRLYPLGLLNGIIPCGLSYTAFIAAGGAGSGEGSPHTGFIKGMLMLLLFGLGTMPSLLILSQLVSKGIGILRKRLYGVAGLFMIISGIIFIYRAFLSL